MRKRLDRRYTVIPAILAITALLGLTLHFSNPIGEPVVSQDDRGLRLLHQQFQQAVALLQHGEYDHAAQGFHEVLKVAPDMPEAHVNMGYALLGLEQFEAARSFFDTATSIRPEQSNAYYGLAIAQEGLGDLRSAVMAMRAYLHVAGVDDKYRRKAEAAIWEWEAELSAERE
ncbi:MAG: tetratricopeptide repeat protein [Gammaproteobacteria bacterium]|nr:tetratricopeptide repeat protein [Gammaproteobacteria bacterium]